jgi:hypothetical protein
VTVVDDRKDFVSMKGLEGNTAVGREGEAPFPVIPNIHGTSFLKISI